MLSRFRPLVAAVVLITVLAAVACGDDESTPLPVSSTPAVTLQASPTGVVQSLPVATATPEPTPTLTPIATLSLFPFSVTDSNGREVTFEAPPERIVAFDSAVVEILFAIGQGSRVVATHDFVSYPPEAADILRLGGAFNMDIEATVALEPDLVFIFSSGALEALEQTGLKVLYLETLSDGFLKVADTIRLWGRIVGRPDAAEVVAADFADRVEGVRQAMISVSEGPAVFQDEGDLWTPGQDTLIAEVFELLKLRNVAHDVSGYIQISPEVLVERDPQIIIASYGDSISGNPAFQGVRAVVDGRVYVPDSDALSIAGPRYIDGIEALARWVYPELFE